MRGLRTFSPLKGCHSSPLASLEQGRSVLAQFPGAPLAGAGPAPAVGWGAPRGVTLRAGGRTGRKTWSVALLISKPLSCP